MTTPECTNPRCRRINGRCVGYHCPHCNEPVGMMGHDCPRHQSRKRVLEDDADRAIRSRRRARHD